MTKTFETANAIGFEENGKLANMVRDNSHNQYFKVITKDENGKIEVIATRCTYSVAYNLIKNFLEK